MSDDGENKREHNQTMNKKTEDNSKNKPTKLWKIFPNIFHFQNLASHQETYSNRSQVYDPRSYTTHHIAHTFKEMKERLTLFPRASYCHPHDYGEYDKA